MGVIACSRRECEGIMCERGNHRYNICSHCFVELVRGGAAVDIEEFMDSVPATCSESTASLLHWDSVFPGREIE